MTTADRVREKLSKCKPAGTDKNGNTEYRSNSPLRPGSDSQSFSLTVAADGEHGAYNDFVSGETGSLYTLAAKLGVTTERAASDRAAIDTTKRAYKDKDDYARAHGVTWDVFAEANWVPETYGTRPALRIPTETGNRWRFLDGEIPKFKSEKGYKRCWFGLRRAIKIAQSTSQPLVWCNGEPSTIVAQSFGVAAFCSPGGENTAIRADLIDELLTLYPDGPFIVAMDCDLAGRKGAQQVSDQLRAAERLVSNVDLGLDSEGDLADFCKLHGEGAAQALLKLPELAIAQEPTKPTPAARPARIRHASKIDDLPDTKWLVQDILPDDGIAMIAGAPGSGKSFYALSIAFELAQQSPVLYVAAEGLRGYKNRLAALRKHTGKDEGMLYFHEGAFQLMNPSEVSDFIAEAHNVVKTPQLIVIDTMARTMAGGDENKTPDMSKYHSACEQIRAAFGCVVLVVHHTGKNGRDPRGSSVIQGNFDTIIGLNKEDDVVVIECQKIKEAEPFEPRYKRMIKIELSDDKSSLVMVDADKVITGPNDKLSPNQYKALETLAMEVNADGLTFTEVQDATYIAKSSLYRVFDTLLKRKYITKSGKLHVITAEGRQKFAQEKFSTKQKAMIAPESGKNDENCELCEQPDGYAETDANKSANSMRTDANKSPDQGAPSANKPTDPPNDANKSRSPEFPTHPQPMSLKHTDDKTESYYSLGG